MPWAFHWVSTEYITASTCSTVDKGGYMLSRERNKAKDFHIRDDGPGGRVLAECGLRQKQSCCALRPTRYT